MNSRGGGGKAKAKERAMRRKCSKTHLYFNNPRQVGGSSGTIVTGRGTTMKYIRLDQAQDNKRELKI